MLRFFTAAALALALAAPAYADETPPPDTPQAETPPTAEPPLAEPPLAEPDRSSQVSMDQLMEYISTVRQCDAVFLSFIRQFNTIGVTIAHTEPPDGVSEDQMTTLAMRYLETSDRVSKALVRMDAAANQTIDMHAQKLGLDADKMKADKTKMSAASDKKYQQMRGIYALDPDTELKFSQPFSQDVEHCMQLAGKEGSS